MSANATNTGSVSSSAASLQSLGAIIYPYLNSLMISHTFLILLVPLIVSLFFFSTPQRRRRPLFFLNVAAVLLAFVVAIIIDAVAIHGILEPLNPWSPAFSIVIGFLGVCQSILVDFTLLLRLTSVYPPRQVGLIWFALIIAAPVALKLTRVINIILFTQAMVDAMNGPNAAVMMPFVFAKKPYLKIEWGSQMIDNTYVSLAFLWRLQGQGNQRVVTNSSRVTLAQRMRTLFQIALGNFLLPTVFSIVQFVCAYRNVNVMLLNQLIVVNTMLATFGVSFATVWAGNINRQEAEMLIDSQRNNTTSRLMTMLKLAPRNFTAQRSTETIDDSECAKV